MGRLPIVIDADLAGTSLADGMLLCAPMVALRSDGRLDLDAEPTGQYYDAEETVALRNARRVTAWEDRAPPPAYLNDALTYSGVEGGSDCRLDAVLWRHARGDGVHYLPSSPLPRDVSIGLGWIHHEEPFRWLQRFTWILDTLIRRMAGVTDVVVDLPPGVWGLAHETLVLMAALSSGQVLPEGYPAWTPDIVWEARPFLVTTPDMNDVLPALEYVAAQSVRLPSLVPVLNRAGESIADVRAKVRRRLGPALGSLGVEEQLVRIDTMPATLGRIFLEQDLKLNEEILGLSSILVKERS